MQLIYIFGITLEGEIPTSYIKDNTVQKYLRRTNSWTILAWIFMREKKASCGQNIWDFLYQWEIESCHNQSKYGREVYANTCGVDPYQNVPQDLQCLSFYYQNSVNY